MMRDHPYPELDEQLRRGAAAFSAKKIPLRALRAWLLALADAADDAYLAKLDNGGDPLERCDQ